MAAYPNPSRFQWVAKRIASNLFKSQEKIEKTYLTYQSNWCHGRGRSQCERFEKKMASNCQKTIEKT